MKRPILVEAVRLLIVLGFVGGGYGLGMRVGAVPYFTVVAAGIGYVAGGVLGRFLQTTTVRIEESASRLSAGEFLAGSVGALLIGSLGALIAAPAIGMLPGHWGWVLFSLVVWISVYTGFRIQRAKSAALLALLNLSDQSKQQAAGPSRDAALVDTSVLVDSRLLSLSRTGFLHRNLLVPEFVLDEARTMANGRDAAPRTKARLGLESLEAIQREGILNVRILEDRVPEIESVDAKLVALATRLEVPLLTNDEPLGQIAELRGVRCLNLHRLVRSLGAVLTPGERASLEIVKAGQEPGEGVGYLNEGSMVVVADAAHRVGETVEIQVTSSTRTPRGRIFFASVAEV